MQVHQLFNQKLLNKYNTSGPRYTSYPTAVEFSADFTQADFEFAVKQSGKQNLSLYLHIPFCHSLCYYCGCNKVITRHREKADIYLDHLIAEIHQQAPLFAGHSVKQIHLGGGTPSFLTKAQMSRLIDELKQAFVIEQNAQNKVEMSIEIDPREIELDYIDHLAAVGFNRLSIGVQDTDKKVQTAINRLQSTEFIASLVSRAKQFGISSVNLDLIYGLPHQNQATFAKTLNDILAMDIDRVSLFSYAHLPQRFAAQRKLKDEWLPNAQQKLDLMHQAMQSLTQAGFVMIGMDHFAKPDDELAIALKQGKLHRNFQGYTTHGNCDLLGLGVSSISAVGRSFSQNVKDLKTYYQAINEQGSALEKGFKLTQDDIIRGEVIRSLMCNLVVDKRKIEQTFAIKFDHYFADELKNLATFIKDNLITLDTNLISVNANACLFIRNIAMTFDAYMQKHLNQQRFSRVI
ncbi:oxygen-independent coproporphyrinogen III oxidase [Catenovulum sp. 2E275]|uniref:oxygen-independent coproporphyrinogen III oxidase n=1 Tax=Catenovulum sp. 2E275 TaxID=2980497 RepID=UPI0021D30DA6|nr:oxygen-independent coproporphyrinogen III oxidase [Catenovulum sp. 2E275]MCU4675692.1 oxygen-independent coproporphyrinogen III oxidase [Catenovulum sp. 2E275]